VRWRARTIVRRHGARRASRPQLKRDSLGCNPTFYVHSGRRDAGAFRPVRSCGWAPVVPRSHSPVSTHPCVGGILRAGRVHASGCSTQNGVTWLRLVGGWCLRSLRSISDFRERDVLAGHIALQPNKRLKLAGALLLKEAVASCPCEHELAFSILALASESPAA